MGYTTLKNTGPSHQYPENSLQSLALRFLREHCENLRFDTEKCSLSDRDGTSLKKKQIPFNMEKDLDRLCLERSLEQFLRTGKKLDAFNVYFCYLEMFVGDYEKTKKMIELLSEFEANGSVLLMKHRDHYSHSVYVFALGLAIFESNAWFRTLYCKEYSLQDNPEAGHHFLKYWGMASLFHDIGYPFELPFEQVTSYFEVDGDNRSERPYIGYHALDYLLTLDSNLQKELTKILGEHQYTNSIELFTDLLMARLGNDYRIDRPGLLTYLQKVPTEPDSMNYFMDHAYFSANLLLKRLFGQLELPMEKTHLDVLTAILLHNSLYKFGIAHIRDEGYIPLRPELHPLAYLLMLCDELQCWDRLAYGRNSKKELYPIGCEFRFTEGQLHTQYIYDIRNENRIASFLEKLKKWEAKPEGKHPKMKAYSEMISIQGNEPEFLEDLKRILNLDHISISIDIQLGKKENYEGSYLSESNFLHLYEFAQILNGRWSSTENWKKAKKDGTVYAFLSDPELSKEFAIRFKDLSLEYKISNLNQAKAFAGYLDAVGCLFTDRVVDLEELDGFTESELTQIGVLEHTRWLKENAEMGWTYGTPNPEERDLLRQHKDMIPGDLPITEEMALENYRRLGKEEQDKDKAPMECMLEILRVLDGLKLYRLH